jgi:lysophospholipase L1-like esterase
MKKSLVALLIFFFGLGIYFFVMNQNNLMPKTIDQTDTSNIKYVAIGDSYTIGNGVLEQDRWPNVLVRHLKEQGIKIELMANPAVSGFRVQDAISQEIDEIERIKPELVTVLIGANDNFSDRRVEDFRADLKELLDSVQKFSSKKTKIILISIPDYTSSPAADRYPQAEVERVRRLIEEYNKVIKQEAGERNLAFADIFPTSQTMTSPEFYIEDGLHPSAKGYALWEKEIFPVVLKQVKN